MSRLGKVKLRIVFPIARWLEDQLGRAAYSEIASKAGLDPDAVDRGESWASTADVAAFLDAAQLRIGDEAAFRQACRHRLAEAYGPLRYIFWALSPASVYRRAARNMHLVTTTGRYTIVEQTHGQQRWRFTSDDAHENRALCVLRQATAEEMPTLWGLPPARVEERGCIAHGDGACEYFVRWTPKQRVWPALLGAVAGGGLGAGLVALGSGGWPLIAALVLAGLAFGQLIALGRHRRNANRFIRESHQALEDVAREESEARQELVELGRRQDEWTALMERQLAERKLALEKVVSAVRRLQQERVTALRGYSHDLRSPLTIMRVVADVLKNTPQGQAPEIGLVDEQIEAVERMDRILSELMAAALDETAAPVLAPEAVSTEALADRIRAQLRALVLGKEIQVSVCCTGDAPRQLHTDRLHFERIIDNLLSNAAKYTERGSIAVELDGRPDELLIKIADSGRGIADDAIAHVFRPYGSDERLRADASHGLGLSVVVRLLGQLGGRLDVMSRVDVGTTFWVHVPLQRDAPGDDNEDSVPTLAEVVTIRRSE
jgi:signal transduction histidine kinase